MASDVVSARTRSGFTLGPLWLQVLIAAVLGVIVGVVWPHEAAGTQALADGFVKLIRMLLAPVIFITVVVGIARMGDLSEVGRVGIKAILYFEVLSTISLIMGGLVADILRPGAGMHIDPHSLNAGAVASYAHVAGQITVVSFIMGIIPSSITDAFARNNMLQVIFFAVLFGVVLAQMKDRASRLVDVLDELVQALFGMVRIVMYLAPLAAFGGMAFTIGKYGIGSVVQLGEFVLAVYATSAVFVFVVLGIVAQATGTPLTISQQVVVLLVLMLTSKGSAGVSGAGFVTLAATLAAMNAIPLAGIVLILGVDRFVNPPRAVLNVIGNSLGTIVVAQWEKAFDRSRAGNIVTQR
jgi:Na+/H+-dicarboxylate symporter